MFRRLLAVVALFALPSISHAQLADYWSFNSQNLDADLGVATLAATWSGVGIEVETFVLHGTELNARLGQNAGHSLTYVDLLTGFSDHKLTISGLDFTGQSGVVVSYATESNGTFAIGETATISYRIGGGSWTTLGELDLPTSVWEVREFSFGSALDNRTDVSIRIAHNAIFEAHEFLRFDNLAVVTAVPEPAAAAVICAAGVAILALSRRRWVR